MNVLGWGVMGFASLSTQGCRRIAAAEFEATSWPRLRAERAQKMFQYRKAMRAAKLSAASLGSQMLRASHSQHFKRDKMQVITTQVRSVAVSNPQGFRDLQSCRLRN